MPCVDDYAGALTCHHISHILPNVLTMKTIWEVDTYFLCFPNTSIESNVSIVTTHVHNTSCWLSPCPKIFPNNGIPVLLINKLHNDP